jgi:type II secretory pathway component PulL
VEDNASLFDLHGHLMSESQPVFPNFFRGYFSIKSILRKLDLTRNQVGLSAILLALLIALPMTNISLMDSYERQYRQKINQTFLSINPNFRRVINPRAQMDELLRNQPSPQTGRIDLNAFAYLRALDLENITRTSINFETTIMLLELNDLPQIKYALIERLIEESGMMIISDELVKTDSSVSGVIQLRYSFE